MTTIVYDAALARVYIDSRLSTSSAVISDDYDKSIKLIDGFMLPTGEVTECQELARLVNGTIKQADKDLNAEGFVVCHSGIYHVMTSDDGDLLRYRLTDSFSIGSGSRYAIGAMDAGATGREAIVIASKRCLFTGGKIRTYKVKEQSK